jgi:hypothetical protein
MIILNGFVRDEFGCWWNLDMIRSLDLRKVEDESYSIVAYVINTTIGTLSDIRTLNKGLTFDEARYILDKAMGL